MRTDIEIREKIASALEARLKLKEQIKESGENITESVEGRSLLVHQATLGGIIAGLYFAIGHDLKDVTDLAGDLNFWD